MTKKQILAYAKEQGFICRVSYWQPMLKEQIINHVLYSQEMEINGWKFCKEK